MNDNIINFNEALNLVNSVSESFTVDVWIPSKQKTIKFKEMDAKQQKKLLGVAIDNSVYNTGFTNSFYEILKNNIIDDVEENFIDNLYILDKASIAITLRRQISETLNIVFDSKNKINKSFDLNEILEKFKICNIPKDEIVEVKNEKNSIKILLKYPTIKTELEFDKEFTKNNKKADQVKTQEDVQDIITEAFISETTKYINEIWICDKEISFMALIPKQKVQIIEKLPSNIMQKILENVSKWKTLSDDILKVEFEDYSKIINIDSLLFLN
jgi:hypothetical protein